VTLFLTSRWVGGEIFNYTVSLFDAIPLVAR
jgi:type III secretion protein S